MAQEMSATELLDGIVWSGGHDVRSQVTIVLDHLCTRLNQLQSIVDELTSETHPKKRYCPICDQLLPDGPPPAIWGKVQLCSQGCRNAWAAGHH